MRKRNSYNVTLQCHACKRKTIKRCHRVCVHNSKCESQCSFSLQIEQGVNVHIWIILHSGAESIYEERHGDFVKNSQQSNQDDQGMPKTKL